MLGCGEERYCTYNNARRSSFVEYDAGLWPGFKLSSGHGCCSRVLQEEFYKLSKGSKPVYKHRRTDYWLQIQERDGERLRAACNGWVTKENATMQRLGNAIFGSGWFHIHLLWTRGCIQVGFIKASVQILTMRRPHVILWHGSNQ